MNFKINLSENESLEKLHTGRNFIQNEKMFKFGLDAVLLADFASKQIRNNNLVLELGCGNGIIPILLSDSSRSKKITGLEIQNEVANLAKKNVKINSLEEKIEIIQGDVKNIKQIFESQSFDAVLSNPPYMKITKGKTSINKEKSIARSEILCTLEDIIKAASFCLKSNGNFFMIHRPERLSEIFLEMKKYNLGVKEMQLVCPYENTSPTMVLLSAKKDFFPELKIKENLIISNKDRTYTEKLQEIYNFSSLGSNLPYKNN